MSTQGLPISSNPKDGGDPSSSDAMLPVRAMPDLVRSTTSLVSAAPCYDSNKEGDENGSLLAVSSSSISSFPLTSNSYTDFNLLAANGNLLISKIRLS